MFDTGVVENRGCHERTAALPVDFRRMDEQNGGTRPRPVSELLLAGIGWASLGAEAADELVDDLARRVGVDTTTMRNAVRDLGASWRAEASRVGVRRDQAVERALAKTGFVRSEEVEDLALRIAQVEHRLRLLERDTPT